jgi:hypothetical protein
LPVYSGAVLPIMKQFSVRNGILHEDGKPVFAIGTSYYASYFPAKVPLLPHEDRIGGMRLDLAEMAETGINIVRFAALGDVKREAGGGISCSFPFIDAMCDHAEKVGISAMVRLMGYSFNFGNATDALKQDVHNNDIPAGWATFLPVCVQHEGIVKDNQDAIKASATHFSRFKSVVSFQTYNEPHTCGTRYDYNPHAIRGWRQWLVDSGRKTAEEARTLDAPRRAPAKGEDPALWAGWIYYKNKALNDYLNALSHTAHAGTPEGRHIETLVGQIAHGIEMGVDYFRSAEGQDICGCDAYTQTLGPNYYLFTEMNELAECAAATQGKHAWIAELNCRTDLNERWWDRETVSAIGSGLKGLMYYEWRAEPRRAGSPEGEMFGMLYSDRRRTAKYDHASALNTLIHSIEGDIVNAEKCRQGIALFTSDTVDSMHSAVEPNTHGELPLRQAYRELRMAGFAVDFTRGCDLERNWLGVKILILPEPEYLSGEEREQVDAFKAKGGVVRIYKKLYFEFEDDLDAHGLMRRLNILPQFCAQSRYLDVKVLRANDGKSFVVCVVNTDGLEEEIPAAPLELNLENAPKIKTIEFLMPGIRQNVRFRQDGGRLVLELPAIASAGILLVR